MEVRRLGPGDDALVVRLVQHDADFGLDDGEAHSTPIDVAAYLADPAVLHWVAEHDGEPVGHLHCTAIRLPYGAGRELLLYAIGVLDAWRRRGVGRALVEAMTAWMDTEGVVDVWVLGDNPGACEFYESMGFRVDDEQPTFLIRP